MGTLTRADLADSLNRRLGHSRADSLEFIEAIVEHMSKALANGENVKISSFGTFIQRHKGVRLGRNPKTGVEVPISPRRSLSFRASPLLKARVEKG